MSAEDLRTLTKLAREAELRREDKKINYFIGVTGGYKFAGATVGVIF